MKYTCQNCEFATDAIDDLLPIENFAMRVSPGEACPAGACPTCGALVKVDIASRLAEQLQRITNQHEALLLSLSQPKPATGWGLIEVEAARELLAELNGNPIDASRTTEARLQLLPYLVDALRLLTVAIAPYSTSNVSGLTSKWVVEARKLLREVQS